MSKVSRRQLLAAGGTAAAAIGFTGCQPPVREFQAQSRLRLAEDTVNAFENHYATACRMCGAGCGTIVRVIEGRAKKVEGNPDHPVNEGKLCARGQASVQELYHPDRVTSPMSRRALRAPLGPLLADSWDQGLSELVRPLRAAQQAGRAGDVVLITGPLSGHRAVIVDRFTSAYGAQWLTLDPNSEAPLREAVKRVFGQDQLPDFDVRNAHLVLSFGADWLESWIAPVHLGIDYGMFRQGSYRAGQSFKPRTVDKPRGYMIHVSSHFDGTAASADEWIFCNPGTEGLVALSIAQVIAAEGLGDAAALGGAAALASFTPEAAQAQTGADPEKVKHAAREFAKQKPAIAIGGGTAGAHTNGTANLSAILALNHLAGSVNKDGGVKFNPTGALAGLAAAVRPSPLGEFERLVARLNAGQVQAVLVYGANPIHELPASLGFAEALPKASFVVSFSSFMDDTAAFADLILPSHLPLEEWGSDVPEPGPGQQVVTIQQPVVQPVFDTRSFFDVLLAAGDELGGRTRTQLPWRTFRDLLREEARKLQALNRGSVIAPSFEVFWAKLLQQGGWWAGPPAPAAAAPAPASAAPVSAVPGVTQVAAARFDGEASQYPFHLVLFEHHGIGHGESAHVPWLAALPDPITSAVWRTWVEVNPRVARDMGLQEGDIVAIESPQGRVEAPVYVSPAAAPNVLAMPMGWGHKEMGRWAKGRGVNPFSLLSSLADASTGASAYGSARVRMSKTGRTTRVSKYEGNVPAYQIPEDPVLKVTRGDEAAH